MTVILSFVLLAVGISSVTLGSLAYLVIKIAGYSYAGYYLNKTYKRNQNIIKIGAIRTLIGLILGFSYYWSMFTFRLSDGPGSMVFLLGIVPVRYFEWWVLTVFFYRKREKFVLDDFLILARLIVLSFVLDVPVIFGVLTVGGFRIC
jgi:hypothetical protein